MDVLPLAIPAMPDTGLLRLARARAALPINVLRQPDVSDTGSVFPNDMHMRVQDGCVNGLVVFR